MTITSNLSQHTVEAKLWVEQTEGEIAMVLRAMANSRGVGTDERPAKLLKLGLKQDRSILRELHRLITTTWCEGNALQRWKEAIIMAIKKKKPSVEILAGFLSCPTQAKCFSR